MTPNEKPASPTQALIDALKPFAKIAEMEPNTPDGASTIVNISRCRDALAALSALDRTTLPPAEGWRPMDSAPKDGRWLFLHVPGHGPTRAHWRARMGWESHNRGREITKATHWRPMFSDPSAPQGSLP